MMKRAVLLMLALFCVLVGLVIVRRIFRLKPNLPVNRQPPSNSKTNLPAGTNPFGVMLPSTQFSADEKAQKARDLGVSYIRTKDIKVDRWNDDCPECKAALNQGLKLVLTLRNGGGAGQPSKPPADLTIYKQKVTQILQTYKPALVVVENEENSAELFYDGTPTEYHAELKAVCEVAHSQKLLCTNGGLVSSLVTILTGNYYTEQGDPQKADEYLRRALGPRYSEYQRASGTAKVADQIKKGKELLAAYKASGADYVNFHWYNADPQALAETVKFLEVASDLPAITNEIGQQKNEEPKQVTDIMSKIVELNLQVAVWFSHDVQGFAGARSLFDESGNLRPNGRAFNDFINKNFR